MSSSLKVTEAYLQKLCSLDELTPNVFRANYLISPTGRTGSAYGGLLFAQSLRAAEQTVDRKIFSPHSIHTFFILNVDTEKPVDYRIQRVRDGRSYCTRTVLAEQNAKVVMTSQVSFCVKENTSIEHQVQMPKVVAPEELVSAIDFCREQLAKHEKGEIELPPGTIETMKHNIADADDNVFEVSSVY